MPETTPFLHHQRKHSQASRTFSPRAFLFGVKVLLAELKTRSHCLAIAGQDKWLRALLYWMEELCRRRYSRRGVCSSDGRERTLPGRHFLQLLSRLWHYLYSMRNASTSPYYDHQGVGALHRGARWPRSCYFYAHWRYARQQGIRGLRSG
jgi:hypothetical protein